MSPWLFRNHDGHIFSFEPRSAGITLSSPEAQINAALLGMGIAEVGIHHAWPYLRSGELKLVLRQYHHPGDYKMVIQYPHRALPAARVRVTVEHLLETFAHDERLHIPLESLAEFEA
ncbi:LysR substrate-binding domain-containing protein [Sodalis sp. RH16]|uniref:LysR substrate-binding domain-containing protein n=1 Tax=Sodalis sp. RH16 TaxID=3394331 RepID=UPI0039B3AF61